MDHNIIYLFKLMPKYEKKFKYLSDSEIERDRKRACKYSRKWNKIRRIIEYQEEGQIC